MVQLLNYCATHPYAKIRYHASDMILYISSDASYLSKAKARSRTGVHFYLGQQDGQTQLINGPLPFLSNIMNHAMSSASEAEVCSIFINAKEAAPLGVMLKEMGHPQRHSYSDGQFDRIWDSEQQSESETVQSNGHEILLDER
jgi:hypothetical protein